LAFGRFNRSDPKFGVDHLPKKSVFAAFLQLVRNPIAHLRVCVEEEEEEEEEEEAEKMNKRKHG
jgi:hypothetical protein